MKNIFGTDKRIRLGIWGLGRGSSFIKAAKELNIDAILETGAEVHTDQQVNMVEPEKE